MTFPDETWDRIVIAVSREALRFGYKLWVDRKTKGSVITRNGPADLTEGAVLIDTSPANSHTSIRRKSAMTIEIHQPELEALIHQRMASGLFKSVEDVLMSALESAPLTGSAGQEMAQRTGADLVRAMQAMPYKDEIGFEHGRSHLPVRDVEF